MCLAVAHSYFWSDDDDGYILYELYPFVLHWVVFPEAYTRNTEDPDTTTAFITYTSKYQALMFSVQTLEEIFLELL